MALAQLTWRESLRDIEACLVANQAKQFHMGLRAPRARSTLSDALTQRDRRIYHALAFEVAPLSPGGSLAVSKILRRLYSSKVRSMSRFDSPPWPTSRERLDLALPPRARSCWQD